MISDGHYSRPLFDNCSLCKKRHFRRQVKKNKTSKKKKVVDRFGLLICQNDGFDTRILNHIFHSPSYMTLSMTSSMIIMSWYLFKSLKTIIDRFRHTMPQITENLNSSWNSYISKQNMHFWHFSAPMLVSIPGPWETVEVSN